MRTLKFLLLFAAATMMIFTSCKKEEETTEPLKTVTISGNVKYDKDATDSISRVGFNPEVDPLPSGKIIFRIDSKDLVSETITGYTYETLQYEAAISNGIYSITLPVVKFNKVNVEIVPVDVEQPQKVFTDPANKTKETQTKVFGSTTRFITICEGERYYEDFIYKRK